MEFPGEQLLIKMWETLIEKGIGGLIEPYYTPWRNKKIALGQIEVEKILNSATDNAEKEALQIGTDKTLLIEQNQTSSSFNNMSQPISVKDIVIQNNAKRLIREEINVTNSIKYASQRLVNDNSEIPKVEVSEDWLNAWRENASKVSDEEVQSLWGNVLAQEFIEPGRYSLRLLEFLKTISKSDALLIEKFAPFVSDTRLIHDISVEADYSITNSAEFLERFSLSSDELNYLEEINILSDVSAGGMVVNYTNFKEHKGVFLARVSISNNRLLILSRKDQSKEAKLNFYKVTKVGQEVLSLINIPISEEYIYWLAQQLAKDFRVDVYISVNGEYKLEKSFDKSK